MNKKIGILFLIFAISMGGIMAQEKYDVTIVIQNNHVSKHVGEDFYLTGSFNNWLPAAVCIGTIPEQGQTVAIQIPDVAAGLFEYKFTRGNWETLASTSKGKLEGPLRAIISSDTVLHANIDGWRDDFPKSTQSQQVHVLDSAFYFPKLDLHKRVWIYLPKDYQQGNKRYPVIYMHDGQDLFDEATSKGRIGPLEWGVDEAIDESPYDAIVVAIAHAEDIEQRQNEYFVRPNSHLENPVGADYLSDIVHTLKPYVDNKYRTLAQKRYTAMAGSSVGGLLTFYAGLLYPNVFGTLGILSPSIWLDEDNTAEIINSLKNKQAIAHQYYFFYGGGNENRIKSDGSQVRMHDDIRRITSLLEGTIPPKKIEVSVNPEGRHGAWYWQKAFPVFFDWWHTQL